jgi:HlyD family secretion protein
MIDRPPVNKTKKTLLLAALLIGLLAIGLRLWLGAPGRSSSAPATYLTQKAELGMITRIISASGPLTPVNQVQVGTQVSGTIKRIHADFNDTVRTGQLLAELDTALLDADLAQARASLASGQAALSLAQSNLRRSRDLVSKGFLSSANLDEQENAVRTAQALTQQQEAALQRAQTNLRNSRIVSPVSGTVVSRDVSVGQTVAAALNTPVLFRIAQDLREMQIEASVSEADIGTLQAGQRVDFTVDAFPGRSFAGRVHQIRNNYTVQQNVVTYTVVIKTRNDTLELRPGMTGYVRVTVAERAQVVRIPNAALRYEPVTAKAQAGAQSVAPTAAQVQRTLWKLDTSGQSVGVSVRLGITDGRFTELVAGDIKPGDALVVGEPASSRELGPKIF